MFFSLKNGLCSLELLLVVLPSLAIIAAVSSSFWSVLVKLTSICGDERDVRETSMSKTEYPPQKSQSC